MIAKFLLTGAMGYILSIISIYLIKALFTYYIRTTQGGSTVSTREIGRQNPPKILSLFSGTSFENWIGPSTQIENLCE